MRTSKMVILIYVIIFSVLLVGTAFSSDKEKELKAIGEMRLKELTNRAKAALDKKYPGEDWERYKFPKFVYISDAVQTGYKIAVKRPELLAKFSCYCFCEGMGHKNLAYCFLEKGAAGGNFDDHASTCNVCFAQAMMAFLWDEMGAADAEMQKAMKEAYGK
ncbi:MAG TPA: PCYCGC motif-containing (lipo)protein [Thermodesulfobacteriota bacterium]|nr:PCYCGC motif-containing (lipo)protein [Thermodesulfobacteriota bacterium]